MYSIIRQTSVPSVVYILAVGHVTDALRKHITKLSIKKTFSHQANYSKHETINNYKEQFSLGYSKVIN